MVSYYFLGNGDVTLLYIHGWKSNKELFLKVANNLKNKYQIVGVDLPGFGNSQLPKEPYDNLKFAEFINQFIDKVRLDKVIVVGHSMGGRIFPLLNNNPKILGFIGTGPAGLPQKSTVKMKIANILNNSKIKTFIPDNVKDILRSRDYKESSGFHRETIKNLLTMDMTEYIKRISKPTLLIWGKNDDKSPIWMANKWKEYIKSSDLKVIENCGHFPERDYSDMTAKYIDKFVCENYK